MMRNYYASILTHHPPARPPPQSQSALQVRDQPQDGDAVPNIAHLPGSEHELTHQRSNALARSAPADGTAARNG